MSPHLWVSHVISSRLCVCLPLQVFAVLALALLVQGCAAPIPLAGPNPADPGVRVPAVAYRPSMGKYPSQRPVEPSGWREQNERVTPAPKN